VQIETLLTYEEIVDEIVKFTALPQQEVEYRVWMEALYLGWNVTKDAKHFRVTPHHYDDKMQQLYQEGDGFIFETLVYWSRPNRQRWIKQTLERIHLYAEKNNLKPSEVEIIVFGDGTGNDSLYLVKNGFNVNYFDIPGSKTYDFATKRFEHYGVLGSYINIVSDYDSCLSSQYNIVISFEVLEHLTDPLSAIKDIASMLKVGGIAIITEAFAGVLDWLPTHLESNAKFANKTPFLFFKNKMLLSWYSQERLFKPMEFTKLDKTTIKDFIALLSDYNVGKPYLSTKLRFFKHLGKRILSFPFWFLSSLWMGLAWASSRAYVTDNK